MQAAEDAAKRLQETKRIPAAEPNKVHEVPAEAAAEGAAIECQPVIKGYTETAINRKRVIKT